jgi:hypothetical protein
MVTIWRAIQNKNANSYAVEMAIRGTLMNEWPLRANSGRSQSDLLFTQVRTSAHPRSHVSFVPKNGSHGSTGRGVFRERC